MPRRPGSASTTVGVVLLGSALLAAIALALLLLIPARLVVSAEINTGMTVSVPAGDRGLYTTLSSWRAAACTLSGADGAPITLRTDMTQQDLIGRPTWYAQGSFHLDRPQRVTVTCTGPAGRFGVGPLVAIGGVLLRVLTGALTVLLAVAGLVLLIIGRSRSHR